MKDSLPLEDEATESLVAEATDAFLEQVQNGQQPALEEYARRYPQIAEILRELLPAVSLMHHSSTGSAVAVSANLSAIGPGVPGFGAGRSGESLGSLGDFRLVQEIGRGGMGIVYEARQISLSRRVALKVLPFAAALDPKQLERFKHEAQAAAQLHHTHIVPVYAVGCERGVYYYAMQFIEGQSLSQLIRQMRERAGRDVEKANPTKTARFESAASEFTAPAAAMTEQPAAPASDTTVAARAENSTLHSIESPAHFRTVANLGVQAAEALEHAHTLGVVHRDIKPGNLLLDAAGNLWVADFGLARCQTDAGLTMTGDFVGTLRYMSPEQAQARRGVVDHRTDIYALGATLYELLTLEPVLAGNDRHELLHQISFEEPIAPRLFNEAIPVDLETIVLKATSKAVDDRYATAQDLADDLRRFLEDKPILAKPPTLLEKAGRWSRRHRTAVLSAVALLLVAVVGLATATALILRQERETELAYQAEAQQRERAEENFQQARRMLDFFTQVSADELADKPGVQAVRKKLLQAALDYYKDFIEQSDDDPSAHAALAASRLRVANILGEIGSQPDAQAAWEMAGDYLHNHPSEAEHHRGLFFAIGHRMGFFHGHGRMSLIMKKGVQDELKLSGDQIRKTTDLMTRQQAATEGLKDLNFEEMKKRFEGLVQTGEQELVAILDPAQLKRLDQISLQMRGPLAFSEPELAEALQLTSTQKQRVRTILGESLPPRFPPYGHHRPFSNPGNESSARDDVAEERDPNARPDFPAGHDPRPPHDFRSHDSFRASAKATMEKLLDVLTADQKTKWSAMTGEAFNDMDRPGRANWPGSDVDYRRRKS